VVSSNKVACSACGAPILSSTAAANDGKCVPCRAGTRASMESNRRKYREQLERSRVDPARIYWSALVQRVFATEDGFARLSALEQKYYVACCLQGEIYNGGLEQFFANSAGEHYERAVAVLEELEAPASLALLRKAKRLLFEDETVPIDMASRRVHIDRTASGARTEQLDALDAAYYEDPDDLDDRIVRFARRHGLY
jgi:hypothetical protein